MNLIVVSGAPRSGTTAVGSVLSFAKKTDYIYEPFNRQAGLESIDRNFCFEGYGLEKGDFKNKVLDIDNFNCRYKSGLYPHDVGFKKYFKLLLGSRNKLTYTRCKYNPTLDNVIWKDPFVIFNIEKLASSGVKCVITYRNIYAIAASFKRMGWKFDTLLLNRALLENNMWAFDESFIKGLDLEHPSVSGGVIWSLVYKNVSLFNSDNIKMVKISDIVNNPIDEYQRLFEWLTLPFTEKCSNKIFNMYNVKGAAIPDKKIAHVKKRDLNSVETYGLNNFSENEKAILDEIFDYTNI